jgi:hypothetical protein
MVTAAARAGQAEQTLIVGLSYPGEEGTMAFSRADIVVTGVDHSGPSYEVRLFLNNPNADVNTPRTLEEGYAGRFTVFGHGGCYGDLGHCDVPLASTDPTDLRRPHPLTPLNTYVTITDALRHLLERGDQLHTVTLVPVSIMPLRKDRKPAPELFRFDDVSLRAYLTATEADVEPA